MRGRSLKKSYAMTTTFEVLLECMKDFYQMFKDDYELDGVAISSYGSIDVENAVIDANCAALSEVYFGQAQDIKDMAFFVIGTGVGGADIKGFFDHMKHEWIIKFLHLYIKDPNIIGLVKKYLKVGVLDDGKLMLNEEGSAQGNIISPILANIYMHNVLTLWYKFIITKECKGDNF